MLLFHANRKLYLTHRMVLCLLTLTDLYPRSVGLSASAELLVKLTFYINITKSLKHILSSRMSALYICQVNETFKKSLEQKHHLQ